jgi:lipoprotein-anchoring transpeptidase ErfK/SrfK
MGWCLQWAIACKESIVTTSAVTTHAVTTSIDFASVPFGAGGAEASRLRQALAAGVAVLFVTSIAEAAPFTIGTPYYSPVPANAPFVAKKPKRSVAVNKTTGKRDEPKSAFGEVPQGPLQLVVSIGQQHVTLYSNGVRVAQSQVSTGTPGHPTPTGVFSVIEKDRWHRSNLYDNAPMFYMQRLTWSGVAMHEGALPGYAASHGCIRLPTSFAQKLWVTTKLGVRVVVARNDVAPYEFAHAKLFNPKPKPDDAKVSDGGPLKGLRPTLAMDDPALRFRRAGVQMAQASTVTTDAGQQVRSDTKPGNKSETDIADQLPGLPEPLGEVSAPVTVEPAPRAATVAPAAAADVEVTGATLEAVKPAAAPAPEAANPVVMPAATPEEPAKPAPAATEPRKSAPIRARSAEPTKRSGQVAVFISKKEKKIFVRHGLVPIFDMPIEIADPEQPLGTHVFTAMEVRDNGTQMRWNAITMPADHSRSATVDAGSRKKKSARNPEPAPRRGADLRQPSTAQQALERVQIPQEAVDLISELLIPGSSLVISDEGLGKETGRYTEFIVLTR